MTVVAAAATVLSVPAAASAQSALAWLPLEDPAYVQLEGLARSGCRAARISPYRPFAVGLVREALARAAVEPRCRGRLLDALVARFAAAPDSARTGLSVGGAVELRITELRGGELVPRWRDIRPVSEGTEPLVGVARARVRWNGGRSLAAVVEGYGVTSVRNDPLIRNQRFRRTSGALDFSEAYLNGRLGPLVLSIGREREAWLGSGRESLVLSAAGPPLDRIAAVAHWSRVEVRALVASISDVVLDPVRDSLPPGDPGRRLRRMLVAHAITWRPSSSLELTLGETALLPREGGGVDLAYTNPLMIYQVTQNDRGHRGDGDDNLTAFGAMRANVGGAVVSGELLVDDIQIDARDRRVFPDQLAWRVELSQRVPLPLPATATASYERVGSYTYLGRSYAKTYQQYDAPLGSLLGPDADLARLGGELWPRGRLRLAAGVAWGRRGALRLEQRPSPDRAGHAGEPFPSTSYARPAVQRALIADASAEWLDGSLPVRVRVQVARVRDVNNVPGARSQLARLAVSTSYRFRYP